MAFPMDEQARRRFVVTVEYDSRGERQTKTFNDPNKAKSFYCRMFNAGRSPKIVPSN